MSERTEIQPADLGTSPWGALGIGAMFVLLASPAVFAIPGELEDGNPLILVALLFPAAGLAFVAVGVRSLLDRRRWGPLTLRLDQHPVPVGGELAGHARVASALPEGVTPEIVLTCQRREIRGSGKNRSTHIDILWSREGPAEVVQHAAPATLAFAFHIPRGLPPSDPDEPLTRGRPQVRWVLAIHAVVPGVDLEREVCVEVGGDAPPVRVRGTAQTTDAAARTEAVDPRFAVFTEAGSQAHVCFPARRQRGRALGMTVFGLVFAGVGAGAGWGALTATALLWPFAAIFGLFGVAIVASGIWALGADVWVHLGEGALTRRVTWFGLPAATARIPLHDLQALRLAVGGTETRGTQQIPYWRVEVARRDGSVLPIVDAIPDTSQAQAIAHRLRLYLAWRGADVPVEDDG